MAKKIYISPSNQNGNTYAYGNTNEQAQCKKIAAYCIAFLKKYGFDVKCTYNNSMYTRVAESNKFKADMHVAIHTNATPKHTTTGGTQILIEKISGEDKKAGNAVLKQLAPLTPGKSAERLIAMPDFYEINSAKALTVYCECEFHDTATGAQFIVKNTQAIGEAIAKGICDYYGVSYAPTKQKTIYRVQCGTFSSKANAEAYAKKLKKAGFDTLIVKAQI